VSDTVPGMSCETGDKPYGRAPVAPQSRTAVRLHQSHFSNGRVSDTVPRL